MQRIVFENPQKSPISNSWFASKRKYHVRKLYVLFCQTHHIFKENPESLDAKAHARLLGDDNQGHLFQLQHLANLLFPKDNQKELYGQHLKWALHALFHGTVKLQADFKMTQFHHDTQHPEHIDSGHKAFIDTMHQESQKQLKNVHLLLENGQNLLQLMLIDQMDNELLMRFLIEEEPMLHKLWGKTTQELFADIFPCQPEAGYTLVGKSYFMAGWLEEALQAYEKSLDINQGLSEPRKQTYLIRAMIRDRDQVTL